LFSNLHKFPNILLGIFQVLLIHIDGYRTLLSYKAMQGGNERTVSEQLSFPYHISETISPFTAVCLSDYIIHTIHLPIIVLHIYYSKTLQLMRQFSMFGCKDYTLLVIEIREDIAISIKESFCFKTVLSKIAISSTYF